ncbi:hypothetical protein M011DRAFT_302934 [Sporormia fimetaria CBS 119925]|uniref:Uncharacterized protein n=1 Tax=Sporormia fimetaria CBS 119925 TaxID=1340428 RepID=A0A6A6VGF0_9PLEO|nr:hypothetical protein M011DRAFT_302934 [Sporormia fimetaria CBS 119925]
METARQLFAGKETRKKEECNSSEVDCTDQNSGMREASDTYSCREGWRTRCRFLLNSPELEVRARAANGGERWGMRGSRNSAVQGKRLPVPAPQSEACFRWVRERLAVRLLFANQMHAAARYLGGALSANLCPSASTGASVVSKENRDDVLEDARPGSDRGLAQGSTMQMVCCRCTPWPRKRPAFDSPLRWLDGGVLAVKSCMRGYACIRIPGRWCESTAVLEPVAG